MQNAQILNLESPPSDEPRPEEPPAIENEFTQLGDLVDQTRTDLRRTRMEVDRQQDKQEAQERRAKVLSMMLGGLIVVFAAAAWFAYSTLRDQRKALAEMLGVQGVTTALSEHLSSVEAKLNQTSSGLPALAQRMDQLQASVKTNLQAARSQAQATATQVGQRLREDVNQSVQMIQSRLAGVESNQHEASERVNQLQEQVAGLKREIASMREETLAAGEKIKQLNDEQQTNGTELSGLGQRISSNQTALDTLANRVERKRVGFELPPRRTEEVAPGISLTVTRADLKKQQIDGTLQFGEDSHNLAIRGQGIHKPITFYMEGENRPIELVLTEITKDGVAGYLIVPAPLATASK
jgi:chromosome segregation ATPase